MNVWNCLWQGLYAGVSYSNKRSDRYFASACKSKRNSCPKVSVIQQAYMKIGFAKSCSPSRGCSLFPRGVQSFSKLIPSGAVAKRGAKHPYYLILVPFFQRRGEQTRITVAHIRASRDCTSLHGHAKANEWYGFSMHIMYHGHVSWPHRSFTIGLVHTSFLFTFPPSFNSG